MPIPSQGLRKCKKCGKEQAIEEFYFRTDGKRLWECKACVKKRSSDWYHRPDKYEDAKKKANAYRRWWLAVIKDKVFLHYGGWVCACCGETERLFLTLDHINNDGAEFRRKIAGKQARGGGQITYMWLAQNGFPPGLQVLCSNCQHGKRMNKGVCPHQARRNDYPQEGVESSDSKRTTAEESVDDIVCSEFKNSAVVVDDGFELSEPN